MADDTINSVQGISDSINQTQKSFGLLERTIERAKGTVREYAQEIATTGDYYEQMAKRGSRALDQWKDKLYDVSKAGKISNIKMGMSLKHLVVNFQEATKKAAEYKNSLNDLSKEYVVQRERLHNTIKTYEELTKKIIDNRAEQQALAIATKKNSSLATVNAEKTQELIKDEIKWAESLKIVKTELDKTAQTTENLEINMGKAAVAANHFDKVLNNQYESMRDDIRESQRLQIHQGKAAGGFKALGASIKEVTVGSEKLWGYLNTFFTGSMFVEGMKLMGDAATQFSSYLRADRTAAMQLGDAVGKKGMWNQFWDANTAITESTRLAGELGMKVDEVQGVANKFRLGTILDRNGRLGEQTLQNLTREAAYFSKVAGIEASEAAEMLDYRIKTLGLSAGDAIADMQGMRATINQMMLANKNANVPMRDMVNIINDASKESGSYVVDTRILTMALQGAANAAANLGASSRQAADVAKGVGAVLSKTPDYISLPTGYNLVDELKGGDSEKFLKNFDESTQKQMRAIREDLKANKTQAYSAAKALMAIAGSSDYVMSKQFERTKKILLKGNMGGLLLAQEFGITNAATAESVARSLRDIADYQSLFAEGSDDALLSMSVNMALNAGKFNEATDGLATQQEKIAKLQEFGFDTKDAENYLNVMEKQGTKKEDLIKQLKTMTKGTVEYKAKLKDLTVLREEYNLATERADPLGKTRQTLVELTKKPLTVETKVEMDVNNLSDAMGSNFDDFAKKFKITNKETIKNMREQAIKQGGLSAKEINSYVMMNNKFIEDQNKNFSAWTNKFAEGPVEALELTVQTLIPWLKAPVGKIITAIAAWSAMLLGTRFFLNGLIRGVLGGTITKSSYRGTYDGTTRALAESGGLGGGLGGGGGGGGGGGPGIGGQRRMARMKKLGFLGRMGRKVRSAAYAAVPFKKSRFFRKAGRTVVRGLQSAMGVKGAATGIARTVKGVGVAGAATKVGSKLLGKTALKTGFKILKGAPILNIAVGGAFALMQAWAIYKKWKAGEKITNSDKAKMVMELASMIPGIGMAVMAGDLIADQTGLYDQLDKLGAKKGTTKYKPLGTTPAKALAGTPATPIPASNLVGSFAPSLANIIGGTAATTAVDRPTAMARGGGGAELSMEPVAGQTYQDNDVIIKFKNFTPMIAQMNKNARQLSLGVV